MIVGLLARGAARPAARRRASRARPRGPPSSVRGFPASRLGGLRWRLMAHPRLRGFMLPPAAGRALVGRSSTPYTGGSDYGDFVEWFVRRMFNTPHSTKQIEDAIGWAHETDAETLIAQRPRRARGAGHRAAISWRLRSGCAARCSSISAPNDKINPHADAKALAAATGGAAGDGSTDGGHAPHARKPVAVNLALREFVERPGGRGERPARDPTVHRADGAAARALRLLADRARPRPARRRHRPRAARRSSPTSQIDWLAQDPVTRVLEARGRAHPPGQPAPGQRVAAHRVRVGRARPALLPRDAAHGRDPDRQLHGVPRRRPRGATTTCGSPTRAGRSTTTCTRTRARSARAYAWLTDFVGWLPMPDGGSARGVADRRLQRRDGRAHRAPPRASATARCSSATPTTSSPTGSGPTCR